MTTALVLAGIADVAPEPSGPAARTGRRVGRLAAPAISDLLG